MNPQRPQYLETAYSGSDIGPNGLPMPPVAIPGGKPAAGASPPPSPASPEVDALIDFRAKMRGGPVASAEAPEKAVPPETTDALIQAVQKVHRVVTARIKYHEAEAARLRASLVPFAALAGTGGPPSDPSSAIEKLVEFARSLPDPPETPT